MTGHRIPPQRGDETQLYRDLNHRLRQLVRRSVIASDDVIDDACSHAWLQLLRHQPRRDTVLPWLTKVAVREAWRLAARERRDRHLDAMPTDHEGRHDPLDTDTRIEARQALEALASLPTRQRTYLAHLISGHSYTEIAAATGTSFTAVNKHLARARTTLRTHPHH